MPLVANLVFQIGEQQDGDHGRPDLDKDGIRGGAYEGFDPKHLLYLLEKHLNIPASPVHLRNGVCCPRHVIRDDHEMLVGLLVIHLDKSKPALIVLQPLEAYQLYLFVREDVLMPVIYTELLNHLEIGIALQPGHEPNAAAVQIVQVSELQISAIHDNHRALWKQAFWDRMDLGGRPGGQVNVNRQGRVMVQDCVRLDGPLSLPIGGPVKKSQANR